MGVSGHWGLVTQEGPKKRVALAGGGRVRGRTVPFPRSRLRSLGAWGGAGKAGGGWPRFTFPCRLGQPAEPPVCQGRGQGRDQSRGQATGRGGAAEGGMGKEGSGGRAAREAGPNRVGRSLGQCWGLEGAQEVGRGGDGADRLEGGRAGGRGTGKRRTVWPSHARS